MPTGNKCLLACCSSHCSWFCIGCIKSDCAVINIIGIFIKREKSENLREIKEKQEQLLRESLLSDQKVLAVLLNNIIKILIRLYL